MKKMISIAIIVLVFATMFCGIVAAANSFGPLLDGPAPNSGDGVSDGSGLDNPVNPGMGPAPNSGDGVSDGPGF